MKSWLKYIYLPLILSVLILSGCKKEKVATSNDRSAEEKRGLTMEGVWKCDATWEVAYITGDGSAYLLVPRSNANTLQDLRFTKDTIFDPEMDAPNRTKEQYVARDNMLYIVKPLESLIFVGWIKNDTLIYGTNYFGGSSAAPRIQINNDAERDAQLKKIQEDIQTQTAEIEYQEQKLKLLAADAPQRAQLTSSIERNKAIAEMNKWLNQQIRAGHTSIYSLPCNMYIRAKGQ